MGNSLSAGLGTVLALGGLGGALGASGAVAPLILGAGALVASTGLTDEIRNLGGAFRRGQDMGRFNDTVTDMMERGANRESAEYDAARIVGFAPPGPRPEQWREMLIRRPGYGFALQTMHMLWQDPLIRPMVEQVVGPRAIPTEAHVTELYQLLGHPGVDPRATAFAEQVQDRIRALRFEQMSGMVAG